MRFNLSKADTQHFFSDWVDIIKPSLDKRLVGSFLSIRLRVSIMIDEEACFGALLEKAR